MGADKSRSASIGKSYGIDDVQDGVEECSVFCNTPQISSSSSHKTAEDGQRMTSALELLVLRKVVDLLLDGSKRQGWRLFLPRFVSESSTSLVVLNVVVSTCF